MNKHQSWHRLCQANEQYRAAWDAGNGPGQPRRESLTAKEERRQRVKQRIAATNRLFGWVASFRRPGEVGAGDTLLRLIDACKPRHGVLKTMMRDELKVCDCEPAKAAETLNRFRPYN